MADQGDDNTPDQRFLAAHRPGENSGADPERPDPERAAKVGDRKATAEAAIEDLARQIAGGDEEAEADQLDLMLDPDLPLFKGPVAHVAKTMEGARGRGRPAGSKNKANQLFRDTLMRMGFRHPGLNLAALANADPRELSAELSVPRWDKKTERWVESSCTPAEALKLIKDANAELLPYFESKRPTEVHVQRRELGVFIMGEMAVDQGDDEGLIDVTRAQEPKSTNSGT
jgi:hypothetical protein